MKRLALVLLLGLATTLPACSAKDSGQNGKSSPKETAKNAEKAATKNESKNEAKALKDGQWPTAIYSKYGIEELSTKGKIVYTEFPPDGPYQYQVNYHGVTREELNSWVNALLAKGFRIHERDKKRLESSKYDHDTMVYLPGERAPYRIRLSFDFSKDMDFEYYSDKPNPAFTVTEKEVHGEMHNFIVYNLAISLNPIKTAPEFKGSIASLGITAEDLKLNDSIRRVNMQENPMGGSISVGFYSDHFTTKEEFAAIRDKIIDTLEAKGGKFSHAMNGQEMSAAQLKEKAIGSYIVENNGKKYMVMVNSDSEFGEFGGSYGLRLMLKK